MSKITYDDKSDISTSSVPAANKIVAADMNEIKSVVNNNDDLIGDLTNLETTVKTNLVGAINNVVDSGTGYVKYCDGTMICYENKSGVKATTTYYNFNQITDNISFPQTFTSIPTVAISSSGYGFLSCQAYNISTTQFTFSELKLDTNTDYNVNYIAIGKWK